MSRVQAQWLTLAFILAMAAITIGYDVWTCEVNGVNSTISRVCKRAFTASPVAFASFCFGLGVYVGHVFLHTE